MRTTVCTYCGKTFNRTMRYCPFCNGEQKKEKVNKTPQCPRCKIDLTIIDYRENELDYCTKCHGVWLDTREFKKLTTERDVYKDDSLPDEYIRKPILKDEGYLPCVHCNSMMSRKNFRRISGVLYDVCRDHGIWLDAGELEQIRTFIANGGLDESQDKEILSNREEIKSLSLEVDQVKFLQKIMHKWNFKRWLFSGF